MKFYLANKWLSLLTCFFLIGCSSSSYYEEKVSKEHETVQPLIDNNQDSMPVNGAIYRENRGGFFANDIRAARVGDILTVTLSESFSASKSTTNSTSKADTFGVTLPPVIFGQQGILGTGASGETLLDNADLTAGAAQTFAGAGTAAQTNTLTGSISVTVVRVFPNGNLEVQGQKKLVLNDGSEYVRVSGIIRPEDISATNTVSSAKLAEAKITYTNAGVYAESGRPGWLSRTFRQITPF